MIVVNFFSKVTLYDHVHIVLHDTHYPFKVDKIKEAGLRCWIS